MISSFDLKISKSTKKHLRGLVITDYSDDVVFCRGGGEFEVTSLHVSACSVCTAR